MMPVAIPGEVVLFIRGYGKMSANAIFATKRACERHFGARHRLNIIDLFREPELANRYGVIATPTLIEFGKGRGRRIVGELSEPRVLDWLVEGGRA